MPLPHTIGAELPRGVRTNGIGKRTDAHLNLTRSLADPPPDSWALARAKQRAALGRAFDDAERTSGRPHRTRVSYAGADDGDAA